MDGRLKKKKVAGKMERMLARVYRALFLVMPVMLFFSYYPVIRLGENESMNLELSLPLVGLVLFAIVGVMLVVARKKASIYIQKWYCALFPVFASLSILWSGNALRGTLTAGIIWAIYIVIMNAVALRDVVADAEYKKKWMRVFLGGAGIAAAWCLVQCVLDLMGVERECSLLCAGCVSEMFGFPHPNGLAIEPQFMGNLLIAPIVVTAWKMNEEKRGRAELLKWAGLLWFFVMVLLVVFSRGAIYATMVAMLFLTGYMMVKGWSGQRGMAIRKLVAMWGVIILSFAMGVVAQGVMAEIGPTNETFGGAVAKSVDQLTLGIVDFRDWNEATGGDEARGGGKHADDLGVMNGARGDVPSGDSEETGENMMVDGDTRASDDSLSSDAIFDGYVEESTEVRKTMTRNGLAVWGRDARTVIMGVGIGGAGTAMWEAGLIDSPKEIIQNEYANVLVETGIIGAMLLGATVIMVVWKLLKRKQMLILVLMVGYGVSLVFFSGLVNALQIYLIPVMMWAIVSVLPSATNES